MEWMLLPLKRYAEFSGRSRRMEYWMFVLFQILLNIVFGILLAAIGGGALISGDVGGLMAAGGAIMILCLLFGLIMLALLIPSIAVGVRRLHDTNRTGWWLLAPLTGYVLMAIGGMVMAGSPDSPGAGGALMMVGWVVTMVMAVVLLVFLVLDGTKGPNRFGEDPKGPAPQEVFA
jgi:uncharacterized membrane protein YhaH (DUF805 family)